MSGGDGESSENCANFAGKKQQQTELDFASSRQHLALFLPGFRRSTRTIPPGSPPERDPHHDANQKEEEKGARQAKTEQRRMVKKR